MVRERVATRAVTYCVLGLLVLLVVAPFYWMVVTSLKIAG